MHPIDYGLCQPVQGKDIVNCVRTCTRYLCLKEHSRYFGYLFAFRYQKPLTANTVFELSDGMRHFYSFFFREKRCMQLGDNVIHFVTFCHEWNF